MALKHKIFAILFILGVSLEAILAFDYAKAVPVGAANGSELFQVRIVAVLVSLLVVYYGYLKREIFYFLGGTRPYREQRIFIGVAAVSRATIYLVFIWAIAFSYLIHL